MQGFNMVALSPFQSTLPVRGATQSCPLSFQFFCISIHAPRAGSDHYPVCRQSAPIEISIHAPRAGSDRTRRCQRSTARISIHAPVRGATALGAACHAPAGDFNPRSPCGERPPYIVSTTGSFKFQSTLPVRGATTGKPDPLPGNGYFNPRSPCGERLCPACMEAGGTSISIHAPRAGSDPHSFRA